MSSVDVIVPCYRYAHYLEQCVHSVLAQEGPAIRVLIIDDASPDHTAEVATALAQLDPRVTFRRHAVNQGHIKTFNEGLAWATADYQLLISADDYLLPGALERAVALMQSHPEVAFTFGKGLLLREDLESRVAPLTAVEGESHVIDGRSFIEFNAFCNIVMTPTAVIRTSVQKRLGGYRSELPHTADLELWLRLAACGSVGVVGAGQAVYRRHHNNMSLAYRLDGRLPDLEQRQTALDMFFRESAFTRPDLKPMQAPVRRALAREALSYAMEALDADSHQTARALESFAARVCPDIAGSASWWMVKCHRILGAKVWKFIKRCARGPRSARARAAHRKSPAWVLAATSGTN
jgi:hypothetical protein